MVNLWKSPQVKETPVLSGMPAQGKQVNKDYI